MRTTLWNRLSDRALAEDTKHIVLDEPTDGVQQENRKHMANAITEDADAGCTYLIVEQNLTLIEKAAHTALAIDHGECIYATTD